MAMRKLGLCAGAVEVQKELSSKTGLELPATFVFDYPSISEMLGFIVKALPHQDPPPAEATAAHTSTPVRGEAGNWPSSLHVGDNGSSKQCSKHLRICCEDYREIVDAASIYYDLA